MKGKRREEQEEEKISERESKNHWKNEERMREIVRGKRRNKREKKEGMKSDKKRGIGRESGIGKRERERKVELNASGVDGNVSTDNSIFEILL